MAWPFENDTSAVIHKIASAKLKYGWLGCRKNLRNSIGKTQEKEKQS